ncbi:MAG TPA: hypothetical protein VMI53_04960 [Opitutaceae bacterium]|nr:hypothetical protein [Opitutaceae bacterium]
MSLNRIEQMVFDYVQAHAEERQFWENKVRVTSAGTMDENTAAAELERELWSYFEERSRVATPFRELVAHQGLRRTSLRNLAELWLRLWTQPRPRRKPPPEDF